MKNAQQMNEKRSSRDVADSSIEETVKIENLEKEERARRDIWHRKYGFGGTKASEAEQSAEKHRKQLYDERIILEKRTLGDGRSPVPGNNTLVVQSLPTAPKNTRSLTNVVSGPHHGPDTTD